MTSTKNLSTTRDHANAPINNKAPGGALGFTLATGRTTTGAKESGWRGGQGRGRDAPMYLGMFH